MIDTRDEMAKKLKKTWSHRRQQVPVNKETYGNCSNCAGGRAVGYGHHQSQQWGLGIAEEKEDC